MSVNIEYKFTKQDFEFVVYGNSDTPIPDEFWEEIAEQAEEEIDLLAAKVIGNLAKKFRMDAGLTSESSSHVFES